MALQKRRRRARRVLASSPRRTSAPSSRDRPLLSLTKPWTKNDKDMFRDPDAVLIPPSTYTRKCIQRMVDTAKPSNLDFKERLFFGATTRHYEPQSFWQFVSQSFRSIYRKREPFFLHPFSVEHVERKASPDHKLEQCG